MRALDSESSQHRPASAGRDETPHHERHQVAPPGARGLLPPWPGRPAVMLEVQHTAGNRAIAAVIAQRCRDYGTSVPRGTGLTEPVQDENHGRWHIHLIPDSEQLGLLKEAFIKFEDFPAGRQHIRMTPDLLVDTNVGLAKRAARRDRRYAAAYEWGSRCLTDYVATHCPRVSAAEVQRRRDAKEAQQARDRARTESLPELQDTGIADVYKTPSSPFGNQFDTPTETSAEVALAEVGVIKGHKDFRYLKRLVVGGETSEWPDDLAPVREALKAKAVAKAEAALAQEQERIEESAPKESRHDSPSEEVAAEKPAVQEEQQDQAERVKAVLTEAMSTHAPAERVRTSLLRIGVPLAMAAVLIALVFYLL